MFKANSQISSCTFNNSPTKARFIVAGLFYLNIFAYSCLANAQGVVAGTNITNIATASYNVNAIPQELIESSPTGNSTSGIGNGNVTQFVVDRRVDLLVTGNSNANVNPGDSQVEVTFTLQNEGNAIQEFNLLVDNLITTDNFDSNNCNTQVTGVSGIPLAGVVLPTTGDIKLSPDQQASVSVRCDIPLDNGGSAILNGHTALIGLIAETVRNENGSNTVATTSTNDANNVETVFADGAGSDDALRDAMHSARRTYIASSSSAAPTLSMDKTIESMIHPGGANTSSTGSEVTYKIQINTSGVGTIENLVISDPTPMDMTYKIGSIRLNNVNQTDLSDGTDNTDYGFTNADTATINLGNFAAGSQYAILLTYIIN